MNKFQNIVKNLYEVFDVKYAILGGELSIDNYLPKIIEVLMKFNIKTRLLTNGYLLDSNYLIKLYKAVFDNDDKIIVSIKSLINDKHIFITGKDNEKILNNI